MAVIKSGLVLSGGGAKGAYEVGVIKTLARLGFKLDAVSGASIGALNGAVVAASPNLQTAADILEAVWTGLDSESVLKLNKSNIRYIALGALHQVLRKALFLNPVSFVAMVAASRIGRIVFTEEDARFMAILDSSPLEKIIEVALDFDTLLGPEGKEFYASVYPSRGGRFLGTVRDLVRYGVSAGESVFLRINDYDQETAIKIILASAAIPIALNAVKVDDEIYRDGGMGNRVEEQGNVPMKPLADAGCTHVVLVMLRQGSLFNRNEWPDITPIEIRPSFDITGGRMLKSTFDFSPQRIRELIQCGEEDAEKYIGNIARAYGLLRNMRRQQKEMAKTCELNHAQEQEYDSGMRKIHEDLHR
ncbi:MAG: patatin-like phospholipase family protein [Candidatus Hydrogenedentales bacterium]|nr:patatin-like phospholipase family protein [Candidatus Hydrogenedentota bacterium]